MAEQLFGFINNLSANQRNYFSCLELEKNKKLLSIINFVQ